MKFEAAERGLDVGAHDDQAVVGERARGDVAARRLGEQQLDRLLDEAGQLGVGGDQVRRGARVVLGLGHQVDGDEGRHGALVGQDEDLAGTGEHVDADVTHDELLGGGHVGVAGADDLVDARYRVGAVRERGDRLSAADAVDLVDADLGCRRERVGVDRAVGRGRHDHDDLVDAGDDGGDGGHQHAGRVLGPTAGDVDARAADGRDLLAEEDAALLGGEPRLRQLAAVEVLDRLGGGGRSRRGTRARPRRRRPRSPRG